MAEPFKNLLNKKVIEGMAGHFQSQWPEFDARGFVAAATKNLEKLELKARTERITDTMIEFFPADFEKSGKILLASLGPPLGDDISAGAVDARGIAGWAITPLTHYVGLRGHDHFELSMRLFKEMTKRASAEFGIRFFLLRSPIKTLSTLKNWAADDNQHVRRLVSEGSRPRLPWAMRLSAFIEDPAPVIELLERLKDDDKEYVRRSVANSLNDISKDHPELVAKIAEQWMKGASQERIKLIRHACRTLLKNGNKKALKVHGFKPPKIQQTSIDIATPKVVFGDALQFSLSIRPDSKQDQSLMIDYIIHHQKANGKTSPKVFKWRTATLSANNTLTLTKKHAIKKITTRVYYPGLHTVEVMVNGVSAGRADFQLLMP
ncbi:DNA alkylation repair protein [Sulfuriflexus mobilis]|uniref:DNA alkylation repair protein n=1 Tax=Sulfuriflexus mobilis TaxID=1811807 RepID=UPI000F818D3A|nr:DNA alkylation repair protein [Sulfuriflexus mobilis]